MRSRHQQPSSPQGQGGRFLVSLFGCSWKVAVVSHHLGQASQETILKAISPVIRGIPWDHALRHFSSEFTLLGSFYPLLERNKGHEEGSVFGRQLLKMSPREVIVSCQAREISRTDRWEPSFSSSNRRSGLFLGKDRLGQPCTSVDTIRSFDQCLLSCPFPPCPALGTEDTAVSRTLMVPALRSCRVSEGSRQTRSEKHKTLGKNKLLCKTEMRNPV